MVGKDKDAGTPRVFLIRHGETEWSRNGRYTGTTELKLTDTGVQQVRGSASVLVGNGKLIDPAKLAHVFVSPRQRALQTYELLFSEERRSDFRDQQKITVSDALAEWEYGKYEGLLTKQIRDGRQERGLDKERPWDIWRDGCEDGETPQQVSDRLDGLIAKIYDFQRSCMHGEAPADVLLVAHGHLLRAFTKRWLKYAMETPLSMMMEPGGCGILSYQHHNIDEPAFLLGLGIPFSAEDTV